MILGMEKIKKINTYLCPNIEIILNSFSIVLITGGDSTMKCDKKVKFFFTFFQWWKKLFFL